MTEDAVLTAPSEAAIPRANVFVLALFLAFAPAVGIGFGRFAYGLILPAMRSDLGLDFAHAGALNTANAIGYLAGALLTTPLTRKISSRTLMLLGLGISVAALAFTGLTRSFPALLLCRAMVGASAAFTFISSTALAARLGISDEENALAMGVVISGGGMGTILTGLVVPMVLANSTTNWPLAWLILAAIGAVTFFAVAWKSKPLAANTASPVPLRAGESASLRPIATVLVAYFLFGLGYIAYMTFLVAYVRGLGAASATVGIVWVLLGVSMVASTFAWRIPLSRERGGRAVAWMAFVGAAASFLLLLSNALPVLLVSAIGFGLSAMPIFTAVTVLIRRFLPISAWTGAIAWSTVIFALGQSLGPIGSGIFSDHFGPRASLIWTFTIMLLGGIIALFQKPHVEISPIQNAASYNAHTEPEFAE